MFDKEISLTVFVVIGIRPKLKFELDKYKLGALIEIVPAYDSDSIFPNSIFEITCPEIGKG